MRELAYEVLDVFTDRAFGGNPLAVIQDGRGLSEAEMQAIAREFNFSESTFILPPERDDSSARVRIFDPFFELPFGGHPTIGTAISLARRRGEDAAHLVLDLGIGPMPCLARRIGGDLWEAAFTSEVPFDVGPEIPAETVARCLGVPVTSIRTTTHAPVMASKGLPYAMVELADQAALDGATPAADAFRDADPEYGRPGLPFAICAYLRADRDLINCRVFDPISGIGEDPATGSAAAALAALICQSEDRECAWRCPRASRWAGQVSSAPMPASATAAHPSSRSPAPP
ncbi:MAG: PhzF family phenazine biosynthesis protein [Pseudomonadota bacterium]